MWWVVWWHSGMPEPQPGPQLILVPQRGEGALLEFFPQPWSPARTSTGSPATTGAGQCGEDAAQHPCLVPALVLLSTHCPPSSAVGQSQHQGQE